MTTPLATSSRTAEIIAGLRAAADLIAREGYTAHPDYEGEQGYDVHGALSRAAGNSGGPGLYLDERLLNAFYGWLEMTGQIQSTRVYRSPDDLVASWELYRNRSAGEVIAELRAAARALQPRRELDDMDVLTLREARALLAASNSDDLSELLASRGTPSAYSLDELTAAGYGLARGYLRTLADLVDALAG